MLIAAIVLITSALFFYTAGVWSERRSGTLRWAHVGLFGLGFALDAAGTSVMSLIAASGATSTGTAAQGVLNQVMATTGLVALLLMAAHLAWAVVVMVRDHANERLMFHRFSVGVWGVWLLPYLTGMAGSMV